MFISEEASNHPSLLSTGSSLRAFSVLNGTSYVSVPLACNHKSIFFSFSDMVPFFEAFISR